MISHWMVYNLYLPQFSSWPKYLQPRFFNHISLAGISNCIPHYSVGCNFLSLPEISSDTKKSSYIHRWSMELLKYLKSVGPQLHNVMIILAIGLTVCSCGSTLWLEWQRVGLDIHSCIYSIFSFVWSQWCCASLNPWTTSQFPPASNRGPAWRLPNASHWRWSLTHGCTRIQWSY